MRNIEFLVFIKTQPAPLLLKGGDNQVKQMK